MCKYFWWWPTSVVARYMLINVPLAYKLWPHINPLGNWWNCSLDENVSSADTHLFFCHKFTAQNCGAQMQFYKYVRCEAQFWKKDCHWDSLNNWPKFMQVCCVHVHPCLYIICVLLNSFWRSKWWQEYSEERDEEKRMWKTPQNTLVCRLGTFKSPPKRKAKAVKQSFLSEYCTIKRADRNSQVRQCLGFCTADS